MPRQIIAFLGDSQLLRLKNIIKLPEEKAVNLCKTGQSVSEALAALHKHIDKNKKLIISNKNAGTWYFVFIFLGSNDLRSIQREPQFNRGDYRDIIQLCRKIFVNVRLIKIPPIPKFHAKCQEIEKKQEVVRLVERG